MQQTLHLLPPASPLLLSPPRICIARLNNASSTLPSKLRLRKKWCAQPLDFLLFNHTTTSGRLLRFSSCIQNIQDPCTLVEEPIPQVFSGLGDTQTAIGVCETRTLPAVLTLADARESLLSVITDLQEKPPLVSSGIFRFQIPFAPEMRALQWLQSQNECSQLLPCCYFSPRSSRGKCGRSGAKLGFDQEDKNVFNSIAGVGCAVLFKGVNSFSSKDWRSIKRFLSKDSPLIRAYGASRFNGETKPSPEWHSFGSFYFFIPQIEFCETFSCSLLAVNVAWDDTLGWVFGKAADAATRALTLLSDQVATGSDMKLLTILKKEHVPCELAWHDIVRRVLETLDNTESKDCSLSKHLPLDSSFLERMELSKVVLARRTKLEVDAVISPLALLASLQGKDPDAYQFCIQAPDGTAFIGSSPERLFYRDGSKVISEAVAATRARGNTECNDFLTSVNLLLSAKDHREFEIVRESVKRKMEMVCKDVKVESDKGLIKHAHVQHLYAFLAGKLDNEDNEFNLISVLHPTPAVCGQPEGLAKDIIGQTEMFDRGMYAGPVGWIGGDKTEFAVGIRSSLMEPCGRFSSRSKCSQGTHFYLYAGVGIVKGSKSSLEWRELDLKISQFEALLQPSLPLDKSINVNALWAELIVEECCRLGVTYFCIAPGSRSSALAVAAAQNPRASCISCIDERSLGFHAIGYGRGSHKPAAVITSSGTAVSNLLPAVVEGSQDCVPLLLLTADRPPELQDTGANQTIDQVNHFGAFVRYHVKLPVADDKVPARMVLTSLDAAVFRATSDPFGPVHVNCPFREPLAGIADGWNPHCLKGLDAWVLGSSPYTKYVKKFLSSARIRDCGISSQMEDVVNIISTAARGLIIVGGLHMEEETWATLLLAEYLGWPVMPDILSGLRLRQVGGVKPLNLHIIDNFDQLLLSTSAQKSILPDVILQIGSRLTSKRLADFLEVCQPLAYILVEEHPYRHDPSHVLTHRVQSSVMEFVTLVNAFGTSCQSKNFSKQMQHLSKVAGLEISFQLQVESPLTEPCIAQIVAKSVKPGSALFLGNSMAIRDVNMYAEGEADNTSDSTDEVHNLPISVLGIQTAGNRGASGIDGVLSTAIGFAVGSQKQVTLLVGDVSFLHDTNGLMLLKERARQPAVTVIVVNNFGGGIFSLLPVANTTPEADFTKFFSTPHDVSIQKLCGAHRVNYMSVKTISQLKEALRFVQLQQLNWVIEVESNIEDNAEFHRLLQSSVMHSVNHALQLMCGSKCTLESMNCDWAEIQTISYFHYRIPLLAHPTTAAENTSDAYREGFILRITLWNGQSGFGEVAPLERLHEEDAIGVEDQLRILVQFLKGVKLDATLALLNGSFSNWLLNDVGIPPNTLLPTVRCGLEMALLGALAASHGCSIADLLLGPTYSVTDDMVSASRVTENTADNEFPDVRVCALVDSDGTPENVALSALELVNQGFCTLKIKVARRASPLEDAAVLLAIRKRVGPNINLRVDANRHWTFAQAVEFTRAVGSCGIQYLEEPIAMPEDIPRFCKETGFPVALDESIDTHGKDFIELMTTFTHPGIVAVIIKPSSVGGFERAALIAKGAQRQGVVAVISAAFESSISLAAYTQFAAYVDRKRLQAITLTDFDKKKLSEQNIVPKTAHGLGTYMWLGSDVVESQRFRVNSVAEGVEASIKDTTDVLKKVQLNMSAVKLKHAEADLCSKIYTIKNLQGSYSFHLLDSGDFHLKSNSNGPVLVFLHGFLGRGEDWLPIIHALSISYRCVSVDLPGHGKTKVEDYSLKDHHELAFGQNVTTENAWSIESISQALSELFKKISKRKIVLVGYSMGARLSLYMSLRFNHQVAAGVIISGSPGLKESGARRERAEKDDALATFLRLHGLQSFVRLWYKKPLWKSLRNHPRFKAIMDTRMQPGDVDALARVLSSLSSGRQPSLWAELGENPTPLLLVVGKKDTKFLNIAQQICGRVSEVPSCDLMDGLTETIVPNFDKLPNDEGFVNFLSQERKEYQLEEDFSVRNEQQEIERPRGRRINEKKSWRTIFEVENSGHAVHLENPLELVYAIRIFLSRLNTASYF